VRLAAVEATSSSLVARAVGTALVFALALGPAARGECGEAGPVNISGNLDLVGESRSDQDGVNTQNYGENPFHTARVRLFADAPIQEHIHAFTEFIYDDGSSKGARLFGGFVRFSDPKGRDIHLEAGKIPLHLGAFPNRSYAPKNSLIGAPLVYEYHTDVREDQVPVRGEDIVANRGRGYFTSYLSPGLTGVGYTGGRALPVLYENCWDFGAVVLGTMVPVEFALGVTNGTAGAPMMNDNNDGKQVLARVGFVPAPWMRAGVSGSRGPYLDSDVNEDLPAGHTVDEYMQKVAAADLELSHGHGVLYSEYVFSRFESPFVGHLDSRSWYVEGKWTVLPGWYVAARFDRMVFGDVALAGGGVEGWDANLWKREIGIGFKPSTRLVAKLVHQESRVDTSPAVIRALAAAQLSVVF
jgi:hypothetical protein